MLYPIRYNFYLTKILLDDIIYTMNIYDKYKYFEILLNELEKLIIFCNNKDINSLDIIKYLNTIRDKPEKKSV